MSNGEDLVQVAVERARADEQAVSISRLGTVLGHPCDQPFLG
jgi:hypothetical protein